MKVEGTTAIVRLFALLCASVPLCEVYAESSAVQQTEKAWPLARGNSLADGVAKTKLPDKPEVVWKVTIEKGAFDGTPVIADGVAYLGDMDGTVYAWKLADGSELWKRKYESGFIASP